MWNLLRVAGIGAVLLGACTFSVGITHARGANLLPHPGARVILARMHAEAKRERTASSTTHLLVKGEIHIVGRTIPITENVYVQAEFFSVLPLHERLRFVGGARVGKRSTKIKGRVWVKGDTICRSKSSSRYSNKGMLRANFPLNSAGAWITHIRYVRATITYGVPTWFIQVTYANNPSQTGNKTSVVNEFVSRRTYKLIKLATFGKLKGSPYVGRVNFSIHERFGHYGEPLHIHLPSPCNPPSSRVSSSGMLPTG